MSGTLNPRIVIIGGGLAGLSAKYFLEKQGYSPILFEKERHFGGLCSSHKKGDYTFDQCGHLFHFKSRKTFHFVKTLLKDNLVKYKRNAFVHCFDGFTRYPFQANLYGLPHSVLKQCLVDFLKANTNGKRENITDFAQWSQSRFGEGINRYFMYPYNRKFWTVLPEELSCEWVKGFVVTPTLTQIIEGTIEEKKRNLGYHSFFWYPRNGGAEELIKAFTSTGNHLYANSKVETIDVESKTIHLATGKKKKYDMLISTMPLPELLKAMKCLPMRVEESLKKLRWVSIYNLNLGLRDMVKPKWHWIYFPDKKYSFFRIGFFHNFSSSIVPSGKGSMYVEVSYSREKPLDKEKIKKKIFSDLERSKMLSSSRQAELMQVNDIQYAYPLYDHNWKASRQTALDYLYDQNILSLGRFGSWQYMSMEDVITQAQQTAKTIKANATVSKN